MEREPIGERTRNALAYKREQRQPTSHPPYGFRANGSKHRMVPVPEELTVVRRIIDRWRLGGSYGRIRCGTERRWHANQTRWPLARRNHP